MRILHVHNINQVASIYTSELAKRGHSVAVYEPSLKGGFAPLPVKLAFMPKRIFALRHIIGSLNTNHYDIVHIHWASYGVLGLVSRVPFIVHCHGTDVRARLKHPLYRPILTTVLRRAAAVLCVTPDLLPIVRAIRPDAIFSPGPIDTEQFVPGETGHLYSPDSWTIMLFARLDPEKGTETAMQGIVRFADRHPGVHVRLLDRGLLKAEYRRRYGQRFEFSPYVADDEVPRLLQSADVIVGQFSGALGLSELQAMSCAKPLIASFCYEDAYPTPPPLCNATSPEEVDGHLENLFQHREVATALGSRARTWVISNHDKKALVTRLETLYESLVGCTREPDLLFS
jgi:glycosyltransferase involved in cell wall biosynthesis